MTPIPHFIIKSRPSGAIFFQGTHPTIVDGIVERELCVRGIYPYECCKTSIPAKIKNCGPFYVYKLSYTDTCDYAYCFGKTFTNLQINKCILIFIRKNVIHQLDYHLGECGPYKICVTDRFHKLTWSTVAPNISLMFNVQRLIKRI